MSGYGIPEMEADLTLIADQDVAGDYMDVLAALHRVAAGVPDLLALLATKTIAQQAYRDHVRGKQPNPNRQGASA